MSLLGLMMFWVLFPLYSKDQTTVYGISQTIYSRLSNVALSIAASTLIGAALAFKFFGFRGFTQCSLAGGIACLSASPYISNPIYAIAFGVAAAVLQALLKSILKGVHFRQKFGPLDGGYSFVFFFQGIVGLCFAAINRAIVRGYSDKLKYGWGDKSTALKAFAAGWIPGGMGIALGLILGLAMSFSTHHEIQDHFTDSTYWVKEGQDSQVKSEK